MTEIRCFSRRLNIIKTDKIRNYTIRVRAVVTPVLSYIQKKKSSGLATLYDYSQKSLMLKVVGNRRGGCPSRRWIEERTETLNIL